ncbi:unnamed protein product [Taenia asiatica]|uniref:DUF126 domain-containing protein n=1 Tax=Taenia asiatica TaxID=60517 RepID=A0A0R3VXQ3_TAEAS|nr:unnamed protein product [Taenia asiatica]
MTANLISSAAHGTRSEREDSQYNDCSRCLSVCIQLFKYSSRGAVYDVYAKVLLPAGKVISTDPTIGCNSAIPTIGGCTFVVITKSSQSPPRSAVVLDPSEGALMFPPHSVMAVEMAVASPPLVERASAT